MNNAALYQARLDHFQNLHERYARLERAISGGRLLTFGLAVAFLFWGFWMIDSPRLEWLAASGSALLLFMLLVLVHGRILAQRDHAAILATINRHALARLSLRWDQFPLASGPQAQADPLGADLDLFGHASLQHLLMPYGTAAGRRTLARWLLEPAKIDTIRARQEAVSELCELLELRQQVQFHAYSMGCERCRIEEFLEWCGKKPLLLGNWFFLAASFLLPAGLVGAVLLRVTGAVSAPWWLAFLAANLAVTLLSSGKVNRILRQVSALERDFPPYIGILALLAKTRFKSPLLQRLLPRASKRGRQAHAELERLDDIISLFELRRSPLLYLPLQACFLWDLHVGRGLERWQAGPGRLAAQWIEDIGTIETLAAFAGLAFDNPGWCVPLLHEQPGGSILETEAMGHPLLQADRRVSNSISLGGNGSLLLVCGSNMSGKTTFMRTIGLNCALAMAGSRVCARSFRLRMVRLFGSINIRDSLVDGRSYFMAELARLKEGIALTEVQDGPPLLCLLDEPLRGTSQNERRQALEVGLGRLLDRGAMVVVTTHDPGLFSGGTLAARSVQVHFSEDYVDSPEGPLMIFDYRLRNGPPGPGNALKLLDLLGVS